jgi:hypothetical protein
MSFSRVTCLLYHTFLTKAKAENQGWDNLVIDSLQVRVLRTATLHWGRCILMDLCKYSAAISRSKKAAPFRRTTPVEHC